MSTQAPERCLFALCETCDGVGTVPADAVHAATGVPDNHRRVVRQPKRPPRELCPSCKGTRYRPVGFGLREATEAVEYVRRYRESYGALPEATG